VGEALDYVLQACEALAEAHVAGIVHRDLKPANLYLTKRADGSPIVKVLDFGISKITPKGANEVAMTKTSALMGSPLYMSPEQMRSTRGADARSDIWSLGIILYELLSGMAAFQAETMPELCARILAEPAPPLRSVRPDVPPAVEAAIARCLEKDPAARFRNVGELAQALAESAPAHSRISVDRATRVILGSGAQVSVPEAGAAYARAPSIPDGAVGLPQTLTSFGATGNAMKRAKRPIIVLAAGGAVVAGLAIALAMRGGPHDREHGSNAGVAAATMAVPKPEPASLLAPTNSLAPVVAPSSAPAPAPAPPSLAPAPAPSLAPAPLRHRPVPSVGKPNVTGRAAEPSSDFGDRK
ncbi:MAG: protein kinase domain-containing protein, partial [Polyangiaceae bacterium]